MGSSTERMWHLMRGSSRGDPEKAVLPALIYTSGRIAGAAGWSLALGWWHWYVGIARTWTEGSAALAAARKKGTTT